MSWWPRTCKNSTWLYVTLDGKSIPVTDARRSPLAAIALRCLGMGMLLTSWLPLIMMITGRGSGPLVAYWIKVGSACFHRARGLTSRPSRKALRDGPPLTLYLRSFDEDESVDEIKTPYKFLNWLINSLNWLIDGSSVGREEKLISNFEVRGPVLAIGRPGEWLPPLGALRVYVDDQYWQEVVHDLICRSASVLIQLSRTDGLRWELREAARLLKPEQLVLYLPLRSGWFKLDRQKYYEKVREWADGCLPVPLPESIGHEYIVCFDADWGPHLLGPGWRPDLSSRSSAGSHPLAGHLTRMVKVKDFQPKRAFFDLTGLSGQERAMILFLLILICLILIAAFLLHRFWMN